MKKFRTVLCILILGTYFMSSCKKGYTCACSSETGFYDGFDIHDTKKRATDKCNAYYKDQYEGKPSYDSIPIGTVHCELQKGE